MQCDKLESRFVGATRLAKREARRDFTVLCKRQQAKTRLAVIEPRGTDRHGCLGSLFAAAARVKTLGQHCSTKGAHGTLSTLSLELCCLAFARTSPAIASDGRWLPAIQCRTRVGVATTHQHSRFRGRIRPCWTRAIMTAHRFERVHPVNLPNRSSDRCQNVACELRLKLFHKSRLSDQGVMRIAR